MHHGAVYCPWVTVVARYEESLAFHQQALVLRPLNPSTYSAIGYVQVNPRIIFTLASHHSHVHLSPLAPHLSPLTSPHLSPPRA